MPNCTVRVTLLTHTHTVARMELNPLGSDGGCTAAAAVERSREVLAVLEDDESM